MDFTISDARYPVGSTVSAYRAAGRLPGAAPSGALVDSATVQSDGTATFEGLDVGTAYVAYALVSGQHVYVHFTTDPGLPAIDFGGDAVIDGGLSVGGDLVVSGETSLQDLTVADLLTILGSLTSAGPLRVSTNNTNFGVQKDKFGNYQNVAYFSAEGGMVFGPGAGDANGFQLDVLMQVPLNLYKRHIHEDFEGAAVSEKWEETVVGGGSVVPATGASVVLVQSGALAGGDSAQLRLTGCNDRLDGAGSRGYFYMQPVDSLNQEITFGYKNLAAAATDYCRFRLTEAGSVGTWQAECANGGVATTVDTGVTASLRREMWYIDMKSLGIVKFWHQDTSTPDNVWTKVAEIATNLPASGTSMQPFFKIAAGTTTNKRLFCDQVYTIRNR